MKYIAAVTLAVLCASPAFAGGSKGALIGSVVAPITTAVSPLNVNALNNVSVLSGNTTSVSAVIPVSLKNPFCLVSWAAARTAAAATGHPTREGAQVPAHVFQSA
jgi:hypothetical protein